MNLKTKISKPGMPVHFVASNPVFQYNRTSDGFAIYGLVALCDFGTATAS